MSQEPLQLLPSERWGELQKAFREDWPRGASAFSVLQIQREWMEKGIDYDFKIYCPFGKVQNGMVVIHEKNDFYEVILQCPSDDVENLRTALRKTEIIDWNRLIIVPYAPYHIIDLIKDLVQDLNLEIELILPSETFVLDTKTTFKDVDLPENITFGLVTDEYVDQIDSTWPHRYPSSTTYFKFLIDIKFGYGLYLNNTLICWLFNNESGNLTHMYTVEKYRKRGYAELLLKLVSNILIKQGKVVTAYCLKDNVNSIKLFNKLGYVKLEDIHVSWCYLRNKIK